MNLLFIVSASIAVLLSVALLPLLTNNFRGTPSSAESADLLVINGIIYTSDASLPFADSMAVVGGKVSAVGNYSSLKNLAGNRTKVIDLDGKILVPGFIDSHVHFINGGMKMMQVNLRGVRKKEEFISEVKNAVSNLSHGSWILGGSWNNDVWGGELPTASWIDDLTPHNPVWLSRMDGHMALANSLALKLAGVSKYTEDPVGGTIMRTTDGEPTGLLIDSAMKFVLSCIPEVGVGERREAMLRASDFALTRGVTTVVDMGRYFPGESPEFSWEDLTEVYRWADFSGKMKIRACLFFPLNTWTSLRDLIQIKGRKLSQWLYLGGLKAFADGSLGSNSALFYEPYADDPQNSGLEVTDIGSLFNMSVASDKFGLQIAIHAIGDKANDLILDMYKSVVSVNGPRDRRFRIEHAQHLVPATTARFAEEGIVASVQPDHLLYDGGSALKKLGEERAQKGSYLFQSLHQSNAVLAFGSDWPVVDINPLNSIRTAMKRIPNGWDKAWIPSERMNLIDALNAYTISAARACFLDKEVGSLSSGKYADFVVLSTDSWEDFVAAEGPAASVEATYVGGVRAYP